MSVEYLVVAGGEVVSSAWLTPEEEVEQVDYRMSNDLCMPAPTTTPLANPTGITVSATALCNYNWRRWSSRCDDPCPSSADSF